VAIEMLLGVLQVIGISHNTAILYSFSYDPTKLIPVF
jgi:hypothetical protein